LLLSSVPTSVRLSCSRCLPIFSSLSASFDLDMNHTGFCFVTRQGEKGGRGKHSVKCGANEGGEKKGEKTVLLRGEQMEGEVVLQDSWALPH